MNPKVDNYLIDGCGRCPLYQTPKCKVNTWQSELRLLRAFALDGGLQEEFKWSQPCYTYKNSNVLLVAAFKDYAFISFFKGSLLPDPDNMLVAPGKNSQAARQLRFTSIVEIEEAGPVVRTFIKQAIELEKQGAKVMFKQRHDALPTELIHKFDMDPELSEAFKKLTPGRQRGYIIYFSQPKQEGTRMSRIEKCRSKILIGEGLHDQYKKSNK